MNFCNFKLYSKAKQFILTPGCRVFDPQQKRIVMYTYPSMMCIFVVGIDVTVPLFPEREPVRGKKTSAKFLFQESWICPTF